jgi:hypothetical protein
MKEPKVIAKFIRFENPKKILSGDDLEDFILDILDMLRNESQPGTVFEIHGLLTVKTLDQWLIEILQKRLQEAGYMAVGRLTEAPQLTKMLRSRFPKNIVPKELCLYVGLPNGWPMLEDELPKMRQSIVALYSH